MVREVLSPDGENLGDGRLAGHDSTHQQPHEIVHGPKIHPALLRQLFERLLRHQQRFFVVGIQDVLWVVWPLARTPPRVERHQSPDRDVVYAAVTELLAHRLSGIVAASSQHFRRGCDVLGLDSGVDVQTVDAERVSVALPLHGNAIQVDDTANHVDAIHLPPAKHGWIAS